MQYIERTITGIDGSTAQFIGYVLDNSPEIDAERTRPSVLIIPGGGYTMTSDREAEPIALQFVAAGYHAFILRYSCAPSVYPTALLEVAQAMRDIIDHAQTWHVDPARIAILGFSAGGHLAADFATTASDHTLREHHIDPALIQPTALMLAYPVITAGEYRHDGSFRALLGDQYGNEEAMNAVSIEHHIDAHTPPVFVWHTVTDDCVPVQNTVLLIDACMNAHVPIEAHLFPQGGHGLALGTSETAWEGINGIEPAVQEWMPLAKAWLERLFTADK